MPDYDDSFIDFYDRKRKYTIGGVKKYNSLKLRNVDAPKPKGFWGRNKYLHYSSERGCPCLLSVKKLNLVSVKENISNCCVDQLNGEEFTTKSGIANPDCTSAATPESPSPFASGHKASFRSTKLARRARSFKEDFLEKISQMRSPPTNSTSGSGGGGGGGGGLIRPHSPRAALGRHGHVATSAGNEEKIPNPAREVELMVRQVQVALKHFRDVVTKDKLEMLPGNGTIVLETVCAIVSSMRILGGEPQNSAALGSATHHVYQSLSRLIKLCDDVLLNGRQSSALAPDNVTEIVTLLEDAVQDLVLVAKDKLSQSQKQPSVMQVPGAAVVTAVATRLDLPAQRNSLPDIPLTPRERQNLEQKSGSKGSANALSLGPGGPATVRSSHSTESVLRAESPTPPPKPPLPSGLCLPDAEVTSLGTPPPLPPKKRSQRAHQLIGECCTSDSSLLGYSCDRMSFRSRSPEDSNSLLSASAGSLDSVLNHSREEDEIRALMGNSHVDDVRRENDISDIPYITNLHTNGSCFDDSLQPLSTLHHSEVATDLNRLSNTDSGFASIHSHRNSVQSFSTSKRSSQQSSSSQWSSSQQNSFKQQMYASEQTMATATATATATSTQLNNVTVAMGHHVTSTEIDVESATTTTTTTTTTFSQHSSLSSSQMSDLSVVQPIFGDDKDTLDSTDEIIPPAIPQKTRSRRGRHERQPSPYDNVPLDNMAGELIPCLMHQSQTNTVSNLTDTENAKPPPLPVKKRHMFQSVAYSVMAYMEMFGNCSHSNDNEFMRHSMHMVQAQWQNQQQQSLDSGLSTTQSCSFVHTSSHHLSTTLTPPPTLSTSTLDHRLSPGQISPARSISPTNNINVNVNVLPPALPPKRSRASSTKSNTSSPPPPPSSSSSQPPISPTTNVDISVSESESELNQNQNQNHIIDNNINNNNKLSPKINRDSGVERASPLSASTPTPINSQKLSPGDISTKSTDTESLVNNDMDLIEQVDIVKYIILKKSDEDGPEIRGGYIDALIVQATNTTIKADDSEDFSYQEAFLTTYRTFISPCDLVTKLIRRHQHFNCQPERKAKAREAFSLLVRVVKDLTVSDLENTLVQMVMDFICQLVCSGSLTQAKLLRTTLIEKYNAKILQNKMLNQQATLTLVAASATLLEFKSEQIAEQMTLLDAELFMKIEIPEVLIWAQEQNEERSPNLTRFTEHFNKMSYWARTKILQSEAKDREKYVMKFIKIMKHLRKINNFNSYLALLSALDSAPIRRLEWQKHITEGLKEYCALIDSSSSFRAYRQALAETSPPCIPYIGLVLQDLTFVHIGNSNLLPDGTINFSKRWQQFNIVENMKRFKKCTYTFKKNERIIAFFRNFDDFIGEDAMWQISESIKPRGGKKAT